MPPYLSLKDITKALDSEGVCLVTAAEVIDSLYDNCGISDTTLSRTYFSATDMGNAPVTVNVTDISGNVTTVQSTVTVLDNIPPVPVLDSLPVITGECFAAITVYPLASDNVSGTITGITDDTLYYDGQGQYTITWVYTDRKGNSSSQLQQVIVSDTIKPTISCKEENFTRIITGDSYTVNGDEYNPYLVDDNCGIGVLVNDYNNSPTLESEILEKSSHSITWTATDVNGNVSNCKINIFVEGYSDIENHRQNNYIVSARKLHFFRYACFKIGHLH